MLLLRDVLARSLFEKYQGDFALLNQVLDAYEPAANRIANTVAVSFVEERERVIRQQQDAIRELSTPVLPVRERLLILPIIGVLDSERARQLTEQLLRGIRTHRAKVVVIDITGAPDVDEAVANHLVQTVDASRLMGASVIITGLSPTIAQTLVTIGVDLSKMNTIGDLQGGLEEAERLLGYTRDPQGGDGRLVNTGPALVSILRQGDTLVASVHTALDDSEMVRFQNDLVRQIGEHRARGVIIDVAALDVLDSFGSRTLRTIAEMARLRGAATVIVGIQPDVAYAMVRLGMGMGERRTALDLEEGLAYLAQAARRLEGRADVSDLEDLTRDYRAAFLRYLPRRSEAALTSGYELGRRAVVEGVSLLDLVSVHHVVLAEVLDDTPPARTRRWSCGRVGVPPRGAVDVRHGPPRPRARSRGRGPRGVTTTSVRVPRRLSAHVEVPGCSRGAAR